jgi:arginase family enzyme
MKSGFGLLGVPSSAAAHGPGQERAPAALRRAGLPARLAAFRDRGIEPALLSMDGGVDLFIPATNPTGILDSMAVAHLLDEPGTAGT